MIDQIESIVIVYSAKDRVTATMRFKNPKLDKMFSSTSDKGIYEAIEKYITKKEPQ